MNENIEAMSEELRKEFPKKSISRIRFDNL